MLYKPSELATELEIPVTSLRTWTKYGMPYQRDGRRRLWINGKQLAQWIETMRQQRPRLKLNSDEAFCLRCQRRVKLVNPKIAYAVKPPLLSGKCPDCGGIINRGIKGDKPR